MPAKSAVEVPDKDVPLRDDIRLLGRILGDTVREQEGEATFEIVERRSFGPLASSRISPTSPRIGIIFGAHAPTCVPPQDRAKEAWPWRWRV